MVVRKTWLVLAAGMTFLAACSTAHLEDESEMEAPERLRVATFNVSMEAENYLERGEAGDQQVLIDRLATGDEAQIKNIAEIIQRTRPDIILLTEFDYIEDPAQGILAFQENYLAQSQGDHGTIHYPYFYYAPVNTGQPSPYDLDRSGEATGSGGDAWGFGKYPGQYGMVLLSKYPIKESEIRTFQHFKWKDMPGHLNVTTSEGEPWYEPAAWEEFRLSSKSHWDVPVQVGDKTVHILAAHPTPPVFDGPENRNGKRNHDEIRFWADYIQGLDYFYDDAGQRGGFVGERPFLILGDLNASANEGDGIKSGIAGLLNSDKVQTELTPTSQGAAEHSDSAFAASHTASWGMRADYVIPSADGLQVENAGVFWPAEGEPGHALVSSRGASSDHRLAWLDVSFTN